LIKNNQQHHELPEEVELKDLKEQLEALTIQAEDQQEKKELHRART
jgi:hypothetical protein